MNHYALEGLDIVNLYAVVKDSVENADVLSFRVTFKGACAEADLLERYDPDTDVRYIVCYVAADVPDLPLGDTCYVSTVPKCNLL